MNRPSSVNQGVAGSSPARGANPFRYLCDLCPTKRADLSQDREGLSILCRSPKTAPPGMRVGSPRMPAGRPRDEAQAVHRGARSRARRWPRAVSRRDAMSPGLPNRAACAARRRPFGRRRALLRWIAGDALQRDRWATFWAGLVLIGLLRARRHNDRERATAQPADEAVR